MLPFDKSRCRESILEIYQKWGQGKMKHEKPELSRKNPYCLPKYRYLELKNFCFQYNDWKRALARLDGWRAQEGDMGGIVKSNIPSDPTATKLHPRRGGGRFPCLNYIEQKPGLSMGEFPKKSEANS